jgi:hypothetical protein
MNADRSLTATEIVAGASSQLTDAGYRRIAGDALQDWPLSNARLYEDRYGIVAVVVYETWEHLRTDWPEAQGALVTFISRHISRSEPKAWDGYLVLMTPGIRGSEGQEEWMRIRYNTSRVRKLIATGEELRTLADVRSTLLPVLPVEIERHVIELDGSVLALVPPILEKHKKVPPDAAEAVVAAFRQQRNMLKALHDHRAAEK